MWLIVDKFEASWVPWYMAISSIPHVFLAWSSGSLISRLGALKIVIWADVSRGILYILFPLLVTDAVPSIGALLILAFISNAGGALFNPAILSLPVILVEADRRPQLNAMIDSCFAFSNVIGPVLSVFLYALLGLKGLMFLNGVSYLVAGILQRGIKVSPVEKSGDAALDGGVQRTAPRKDGPMAVLRREDLVRRMLLAFAALNFFTAPLVMVLPLFVKNVYGLQIGGLATLETTFGLGAVVAAAALSVLKLGPRLGGRIILAILLLGFGFAAFSLSRELALGAVALFFVGVTASAANVWILTLFQTVVPTDDVPVIMAWVNSIAVSATPVSLAIAGALLSGLQVTHLALACSLAVIFAGSMLFFIPRLREV